MNRFQLPNMDYIRKDDEQYARTLDAVTSAINRIADQGNINLTGSQVGAPQPISSLNVSEAGGIHDIQIVDNSPAYSGIQYHVEYSQTPDFANTHKIDLGSSQNHRANLGPGTYYWRAASSYNPASPSGYVYHGGISPKAAGSGAYSGPPMQQGQGFSGKYRGTSNPPIRK